MRARHLFIYNFGVVLYLVLGLLVYLLNSGVVQAAPITVSNTNDSGSGSLREAIDLANSNPDVSSITFNIPTNCPQIIPSSAMPPITAPVTIDASAQACTNGSAEAPNVELSGNGAGSGAIGLRVTGNGAGSTIRGLIINRFNANGIFLDSSNNIIVGNYIGLTADGSAGASNGSDGVGIYSGISIAPASTNTIGGTTTADRNVISGNVGNGVGITATNGGVASNNVISGNWIGTNAAGTGGIGNAGDGILLNDAGNGTLIGNTIGGTTGTTPGGGCTGACNLVSGNTANGLGLWHSGVSGSIVSGNFAGTNPAGTAALANGNIGIEVNETPNNTVGGTTAAARNIFSGNNGAGVFLTGAAATGNVISGNYIGTNSAGTGAVGNQNMGVGVGPSPGATGPNSSTIGGTTGTTPGGACTGACNLISGNKGNGFYFEAVESSGHLILGNYIGTDAAGTGSVGNVGDGIGILNTPNLTIGNNTAEGRNIIAASGVRGIVLAAGSGVRIQGNYIGMSTTGGSMGNTNRGVVIANAIDTAIIGNSIAFNGGIGIDLGNNAVTNLNDWGDGDGGGNRLQNFPDIFAARNQGGSTKIGGFFNSQANTGYRIEFFSNDGCNGGPPNNYGEGQTFLGSTDVTTDAFGNAGISYTTPSPIPGVKYITTTATKKSGSTPSETSEFANCILVDVAKPAVTNGDTWFLKYFLSTGPGDFAFRYGFPAYLLMCAWNPGMPGAKLPVVFSGGSWFMRASYTTGPADVSFSFGPGNGRPVCGDWNGDGIDTIGVVTPDSNWSLRNSNNGGAADAGSFQFGPWNSTPVVGDWNGDGTDTIGLRDNSNNWYLRNSNNGGTPDAGEFNYGFTPSYVVAGDWDGNGTDTIGSVSLGGTWALKNSNGSGGSDVNFQLGFPGAVPVIW